jgi:hypothetical protein
MLTVLLTKIISFHDKMYQELGMFVKIMNDCAKLQKIQRSI